MLPTTTNNPGLIARKLKAAQRQLGELTIGQIIMLLQAEGSGLARSFSQALRQSAPHDFAGPTPEDACTLATRGLIVAVERRYRSTERGAIFAQAIMRSSDP